MRKWIPYQAAVDEFKKIGIDQHQSIFGFSVSRKGILKTDFEMVKQAASQIGIKMAGDLLSNGNALSAFRQLGGRKEAKKNERPHLRVAILGAFFSPVGEILKAFEQKGYPCEVTSSGDSPFEGIINIYDEPEKTPLASFNFDLFFNRKKEPSICIGNMHGYSSRREAIDAFKAKTGKSLLDFFIAAAKKGFHHPEQVIALNPKRHEAYRIPNIDVILTKLEIAKKISPSEHQQMRVAFNLLASTSADDFHIQNKREKFETFRKLMSLPPEQRPPQRIMDLVQQEINGIQTRGTGMHKAAFKKAGFKHTKSRYWRLRRTQK